MSPAVPSTTSWASSYASPQKNRDTSADSQWKSSVSRAITFGSPKQRQASATNQASADNSKCAREHFEASRWSDRSKWGFDFYNEVPIKNNRYDWKSCSSKR
ncbi:hypothetical protein HDE_03370 [Halotydeus destructor]|nr:hypothetical protein HDE_03370 [Halotydeus destructor]